MPIHNGQKYEGYMYDETMFVAKLTGGRTIAEVILSSAAFISFSSHHIIKDTIKRYMK